MKKQENKNFQENNQLTIISPHKVRLSQNGNTVMVFLNQKTVMMFSKNYIQAVIDRKYQKKGA